MQSRTKSTIGTGTYFTEICRRTVFAAGIFDTAGLAFKIPLGGPGSLAETLKKQKEAFKDAAESKAGLFVSKMIHLSGKAEEALGELLQDLKANEHTLRFMDSQDRRDLRRAVQGLGDVAEFSNAKSETALKISVILDTAFRGSAFGFSKIEDVSKLIRDARVPFCGERDKMELLRKAIKTDPRDISNQEQRQFCISLFEAFGRDLVKESVSFLTFRENPHMTGRCGHKLGSRAYCLEMLKRALPPEFLDNVASGTRMKDAVLNSVYTVAYRLMEDLRRASDKGEYLEDGQAAAVRAVLLHDLNKLNPRVGALTSGLDELLERAVKTAENFSKGAYYITDPDSAGGAGHSSLLLQDKGGEYWYFFWGGTGFYTDKIVQVEKLPASVDPSNLDEVNKWIAGNVDKFGRQLLGAGSFGGIGVTPELDSYNEEVFIEGDFSDSIEYALMLRDTDGGKYLLTGDNCAQKSIDALLEGHFKDLDYATEEDIKHYLKNIRTETVPNWMHLGIKTLFKNSISSNEQDYRKYRRYHGEVYPGGGR